MGAGWGIMYWCGRHRFHSDLLLVNLQKLVYCDVPRCCLTWRACSLRLFTFLDEGVYWLKGLRFMAPHVSMQSYAGPLLLDVGTSHRMTDHEDWSRRL